MVKVNHRYGYFRGFAKTTMHVKAEPGELKLPAVNEGSYEHLQGARFSRQEHNRIRLLTLRQAAGEALTTEFRMPDEMRCFPLKRADCSVDN